MNVERLTHRSYTVCWVDIATVFSIVIQAPVVPILFPKLVEVVNVSSFSVNDFTKDALLCQY